MVAVPDADLLFFAPDPRTSVSLYVAYVALSSSVASVAYEPKTAYVPYSRLHAAIKAV